MEARLHLKRAASLAWMSQYDAAVADFEKAMTFKGLFGEQQLSAMQDDIEALKRRKESQEIKLQGDIYFARNMMNEALEQYHKAMETDDLNEYALSNISVIHLKRQNYDECLKYTNQSLAIIENFQNDTKDFQKDNVLEVKLLQRRAKCLEIKAEYESAKEDLDRAMFLDPENPAVKDAQTRVQKHLNTIKFDEYRTVANDYLKGKKFVEAMEYYEKCLKITRKATTLDNIAIYVNKIACLLSLEKHNLVVSECNDALRLIKNYKNRNDGKHSKED